ncbi:HdeD family acid-resistance protein [Vibrio hangzhouensis]|uniref:HdeD family acid-resistance protein n=1 Tax=Vibrio hangzhouensis TaxID=462991 RepID=UPI0028F41C1C|nr:DUF308 domain-containing protein [Vibrio hangzhouensis]
MEDKRPILTQCLALPILLTAPFRSAPETLPCLSGTEAVSLSEVLYIIGGLFILFKPLAGLVTITMVLVMILKGLTRIFFRLANRSLPSSGLIIFSGILSVIISGYFFTLLEDPAFSTSLLGTFIGIFLLIEGICFVFLGMKLKQLRN